MEAEISQKPESVMIALLLNLPRPESFTQVRMLDEVRRGFATQSVTATIKRIDPEGSVFHINTIVPKRTLARGAKSGRLSPRTSENVMALLTAYVAALQAYGDHERAVRFLTRPHALLDNRKPIDLAKESPFGAQVVKDVLVAAEAGVAV